MDENEPCFSRGPRIGDNGVPVCKLDFGHGGLHKPDPEDGWGDTTYWGGPLMRDMTLVHQWRAEHGRDQRTGEVIPPEMMLPVDDFTRQLIDAWVEHEATRPDYEDGELVNEEAKRLEMDRWARVNDGWMSVVGSNLSMIALREAQARRKRGE